MKDSGESVEGAGNDVVGEGRVGEDMRGWQVYV